MNQSMVKQLAEAVAQRLYNAYRAHNCGDSAVSGQRIPEWEQLSATGKGAWLAVANEATHFASFAIRHAQNQKPAQAMIFEYTD